MLQRVLPERQGAGLDTAAAENSAWLSPLRWHAATTACHWAQSAVGLDGRGPAVARVRVFAMTRVTSGDEIANIFAAGAPGYQMRFTGRLPGQRREENENAVVICFFSSLLERRSAGFAGGSSARGPAGERRAGQDLPRTSHPPFERSANFSRLG